MIKKIEQWKHHASTSLDVLTWILEQLLDLVNPGLTRGCVFTHQRHTAGPPSVPRPSLCVGRGRRGKERVRLSEGKRVREKEWGQGETRKRLSEGKRVGICVLY